MTAALGLGAVAVAVGLLLTAARWALAARKEATATVLVDAIDAVLPQSQCAQCGYPGCRPYAEAVAAGEKLDRCLPGGPGTAEKIKQLLGREAESAELPEASEQVARIVEVDCVGCALCMEACPVDAIAGAPSYLHAVIANQCTGCELCVPACPVDCIAMIESVAGRTPAAIVAEASDLPPLDEWASAEAGLERIEAAGIVGMGGGGYPTAQKIREAMAGNADVLIGNGVACEPGASSDLALLRDHLDAVVAGLGIVAGCLGDNVQTVLAVPRGSDFAVPSSDLALRIAEADIDHPSGEERRLVAHVAGRLVPAGAYPTDVGVLVLNVATLFAIFEAVRLGKRLRRRLVTVSGADRWIEFGTPVAELGQARIGGRLTGWPAASDAVVDATTFCLSNNAAGSSAMPCIQCGWCEPACPEGLSPQALHSAFETGALDETVGECIECGACTAVCPSSLDLVNEFRALKERTQREQRSQSLAQESRRRVNAKSERLARQARLRDEQRDARLNVAHRW